MSAFKVKLAIDQGATFRKSLTYKTGTPPAVPVAVNLTGFKARMQIRATLDSATVLASLTTENGGITLGGVTGTIDLYLRDADTTLLTFDSAVYDMELISPGVPPTGGDVIRFISGVVVLSPEITR